MAYTFSVNNSPATGAVAMYTLISTLVTAGWTKVMDSDGTTYSASGVQVTSGNVGTNGLGNSSAWVRLKAPLVGGKQREIIIQRGTTSLNWRLKYSAYGGFIGGAPAATVAPTNENSFVYSESNQDATTSLRTTSTVGTGQSFTALGTILGSARFYLKKTGAPTGFAIAKVYAHSGSLGTTSVPTGTALANSVPFDVSTLTASYALTELKFIGSESITLTNATNYVVTIEYNGGSVGNTLDVGRDGSSPTATGNSSTWDGATWTAVSTSDLCAYVCTGVQDEVFMLGGGTDLVPTFFAFFTTDANYRYHVAAGGAAEFYSFVAWAQQNGTTTMTGSTGICLDVMAAGSFPSADIDPAVMYCSTLSSAFGGDFVTISFPTTNSTNSAKARAWLGPALFAGASLTSNNVNVGIVCYGNSQVGNSATFATNPWINNDDLVPCLWGSANFINPRGIKGFSTLFMFGSIAHSNGDTCDSIAPGSKDKIYFGGLWLPWSGATPLI